MASLERNWHSSGGKGRVWYQCRLNMAFCLLISSDIIIQRRIWRSQDFSFLSLKTKCHVENVLRLGIYIYHIEGRSSYATALESHRLPMLTYAITLCHIAKGA